MGLARLFTWCAALILAAQASFATQLVQDVIRVLKVDEVASILQDEGLQHGDDLEADMLGGHGGSYFRERIAALYDAETMADVLTGALHEGLSEEQMQAVVTYFGTEQGQRILSLENAGRVAMADPAVEDIARRTYAAVAGSDDPHLTDVERFVSVNDLVEKNITAALDSNYHFMRGLSDGGGSRMGQEDILAEVWAQEPDVRADTTAWIYGFLLMAYKPLSHAELEAYIDFSATPAGQALNHALFDGFDQIYNEISYGLGLAVAQAMNSSDI